jgi:membrane fusion protein, multidrug efflux system
MENTMRPLTASLHAACRTMSRLPACLGVLLLLGACDDNAPPPAPEIRPVRVVTVAPRSGGDSVSITGTVAAETEVNLAFRIDGRMVERLVNVGDRVTAGQVVARLDRQNEDNSLRAARAQLSATRAQLTEARNNYQRQRELLQTGFTTRVRYDQATQTLRSAESAMDAAQAQANIAENRLGYTELHADAGGTVTARGAENGEVVQPGRMIVQIAREEGRDAVFDVPPAMKDQAPADPVIEVALTMDPAVRAIGRVREVSPRADPVTGTFRVRVGLDAPPPAMRLGSTVTGRMEIGGGVAIEVPASALTRAQQQPAVWVVDPATQTVALRPVEVLRFDPARVLIAQGLETGEIVVTAGVQALRPGQKVRLLGSVSAAR